MLPRGKRHSTLWARIHYPAMASYVRIWESEVASASREGCQPSTARTLHELHAEYMPPRLSEDGELAVARLMAYNNTWLISLIDEHPHLVRDLVKSRPGLVKRLWAFDYSPQLVIALLIEEHYGREEAARYALALATGVAT
jgi:hypothetical protein